MIDLPKATWRVTLDGEDLTDRLNPRLLSATISEKREDEADQLDIVLDDRDGSLAIPRAGAVLTVAMGWERGTGLPLGLIAKGTFKVDEADWNGEMDTITIRARSADFTDAFRVRKERSFVGQTVATVLGAIAGDNGLATAIDAALGGQIIPALGPGAKSDAALLRALGKRFDAVATVKNGKLIFSPIGNGRSPSGAALPSLSIDRSEVNRPSYKRIERETYGGVVAVWHDKATGQRKEVQIGGGGDGKPKRIRKTFATEADARQHAQAEDSRISRAHAKLTITLPLGRPDLFPDRLLRVTGFKPEINGLEWIVGATTHVCDAQGGLVSNLILEARK